MNAANIRRRAWVVASALFVIAILAAYLLFSESVGILLALWFNISTGEYAHGFLVLAISLYLVIMQRKQLRCLTPAPEYRALPLVLAASLLWSAAVLVDVNMMQTVSLVVLLAGLVWAVFGTQIARRLLFPVFFLFFAIPVWFPLSPLLQDLTADIVFWGIRLIEVPAFKEQNMIVVPAGRLSVEEACSGLRYLLAALTLGALYAYLSYHTLVARLTVVIVAAAAALLANIIRVFVVVYLGYATDMQHPWVHDHLMLGWYIFGALVVLLLYVDTRLARHPQQVAVDNVDADTNDSISDRNEPTARLIAVFLASMLLLATGPFLVHKAGSSEELAATRLLIDWPQATGWSGPLPVDIDWKPEYEGAIDLQKAYRKNDRTITVYIGYYHRQKQGREVINDLNRIAGDDWQAYYSHHRSIQTQDGSVLEQLLKNTAGEQRLVWFWYNIAGYDTTDKYEAKLLELPALVRGRNDAYVMALAIDLQGEAEQARKQLSVFFSEMRELLTTSVADGTITDDAE